MRQGLGLLSLVPGADLGPGQSATLNVPVPFGRAGEFRIEVGYQPIRNTPLSGSKSWLDPWLVRFPAIGERLSSRVAHLDGVVPSDWMKAPNEAVQRTGASGSAQPTNRTSSTAGSGR